MNKIGVVINPPKPTKVILLLSKKIKNVLKNILKINISLFLELNTILFILLLLIFFK